MSDLEKTTRRWSRERVERELAFRDENGGDPSAVRWIAAVEAEATKRGIPFEKVTAHGA